MDEDVEPWLRSYSDARSQAERDRMARLVAAVMQPGAALRRADIQSARETWATICANLRGTHGASQ